MRSCPAQSNCERSCSLSIPCTEYKGALVFETGRLFASPAGVRGAARTKRLLGRCNFFSKCSLLLHFRGGVSKEATLFLFCSLFHWCAFRLSPFSLYPLPVIHWPADIHIYTYTICDKSNTMVLIGRMQRAVYAGIPPFFVRCVRVSSRSHVWWIFFNILFYFVGIHCSFFTGPSNVYCTLFIGPLLLLCTLFVVPSRYAMKLMPSPWTSESWRRAMS